VDHCKGSCAQVQSLLVEDIKDLALLLVGRTDQPEPAHVDRSPPLLALEELVLEDLRLLPLQLLLEIELAQPKRRVDLVLPVEAAGGLVLRTVEVFYLLIEKLLLILADDRVRLLQI